MEPFAVFCTAAADADEEAVYASLSTLGFRCRRNRLLLGRPGSSTRLEVLSMLAMVIKTCYYVTCNHLLQQPSLGFFGSKNTFCVWRRRLLARFSIESNESIFEIDNMATQHGQMYR